MAFRIATTTAAALISLALDVRCATAEPMSPVAERRAATIPTALVQPTAVSVLLSDGTTATVTPAERTAPAMPQANEARTPPEPPAVGPSPAPPPSRLHPPSAPPDTALQKIQGFCATPDPAVQAAQFASILPQVSGYGITVGTLGADGALNRSERLVPSGTQQALELSKPVDLSRFSLTTMMMAADRPGASSGEAKPADAGAGPNKDTVQVRLLRWEQGQAAARPQGEPPQPGGGDVRTILIKVPPIAVSWGPLWPVSRQLFAVVACDRAGGTEIPQVFVADRSVSHANWVRFDTALVGLLLWLSAAFAFDRSTRPPSPAPGTNRGPAHGAPVRRDRIGTYASLLNPLRFTQDPFGFASASRLQVWWFTMIVATTLTYVFMRAGYLSEISTDVLALLGISAGGSAASALVTSTKAADNADLTFRTDRWLRRHAIEYPPRTPKWSDLFLSAGAFDPYKFQVVVFSTLTGIWILTSGLGNLSELHIPANISTLLGISQAVYVSGKLVGSSDDQKRRLNAAVDEAIRLEKAFWALVPVDAPYRREAAERGLALGAGQGMPPRVAQLSDPAGAARTAYDLFNEQARAAMGLADTVLGGTNTLAAILPVMPPDDTAMPDLPRQTGPTATVTATPAPAP